MAHAIIDYILTLFKTVFFTIPFLAALSTFLLTKDFFFQLYSQPRQEYCEHEGIYYKDIGQMYEAIRNSSVPIPFRGYEYAYPCFVTNLHIESLSKFKEVLFYAATYGAVDEIPETIGKLKTLEKLQIQDQRLTFVPVEIGELGNLKTLNLGGNKISGLPASVGKLTSLESLLVFDNKLVSLPNEISSLLSLRVLDLRNNSLSTLPKEVYQLKSLEYLYLGGNKIGPQEQILLQKALPNTKIFF